MYLERQEGADDRATLVADKVSYAPQPKDIALASWEWWRALPWTETPKGEAELTRRQKILEALREEQPLSRRAIEAAVKGSGAAIGKALTGLVADGELTLETEGAGKPHWYSIAASQ